MLFSLGLLIGCSEQTTGPVEVHWDRDTCERCRMVVSDPRHSAQVRYVNEKNKSRIRHFDDIGCAVIWLKDKPWRDTASTEIWVTDHRDGKWIDAKTAHYVKGHVTPMEYGLGAQKDPIATSLDYKGAKQHIYSIETRFNKHGVDLESGAHNHGTQ
jgi:nitrous oxide reductase accessory protein NosL